MGLTDLIFVSMEDWDEVWRRNQFVCAELARRYPLMKILFVGLPRNLSHDLRKLRLTSAREPALRKPPGAENISVAHPWKLFPNTLLAGRKANEQMMRRQVRKLARRLGISRPLLWLNPHFAVHMAGRMGESAVIYDVTDDWISLTQKPWLRELTRRQDRELCRKADAVMVCSQRLLEMKRMLSPHAHLIQNGVDAQHYQRVLDGQGPLPEPARAWKKPVLGYTGSIHADRVDVDLVEAVGRKMPQATLVLIGPNFLPAGDRARLEACPNVKFTGPVPYDRVPDFMRAFDVCITPHRSSEFTESLNPIKLWEYLAAGKPIVSTNVAGFRDFPQLVRLCSGPEEFVRGIDEALQEKGELVNARRNEAARHSWRVRVDEIELVLQGIAEKIDGSRQAPGPDQHAAVSAA
jgi:glycosyltransferase involved in cell wall biosynthesis